MIQVFRLNSVSLYLHHLCSGDSWGVVDNFNPKRFFNARLWISYVFHSSIKSIKFPHTVRQRLPLWSYKTASRNFPFTLGESISLILWSQLTVDRMSKMPGFFCLNKWYILNYFLILKIKLTEFVLSIALPRDVLKIFHFEFLKGFNLIVCINVFNANMRNHCAFDETLPVINHQQE